MALKFLPVAGAALALSFVAPGAQAEELQAGKSPGQMFSSNCSACHRGARGLSKSPNVGEVAGFLRQHYTTSREMAASLAGYVVSSGVDPSGRRAREASPGNAKPDPRQQRQEEQRQAARPPQAVPTPEPARAEEQTPEQRAAARRAAAEERAKREERAALREERARARAAQDAASDPDPVVIARDPVPLAHDRASSRADQSRIYSPPARQAAQPAAQPSVPTQTETRTAALPAAPAPAPAPAATPAAAVTPAATSEPTTMRTENPAADAAGVHPADNNAGSSVQPFSAPLP